MSRSDTPEQILKSTETVSEPFVASGRCRISLLGIGTANANTSNWFLEVIPKGADQSVANNWNELNTQPFSSARGRKGMEFNATYAEFYRLNNKAATTPSSGVVAYITTLPTVILNRG